MKEPARDKEGLQSRTQSLKPRREESVAPMSVRETTQTVCPGATTAYAALILRSKESTAEADFSQKFLMCNLFREGVIRGSAVSPPTGINCSNSKNNNKSS